MKVKPNPYIVSFAADADGGPDHVAFLLTTFYVKFKKKGEVVGEGEICQVEYGEVSYYSLCKCCDQLNRDTPTILTMGVDFDEIEYQ